MSSSGSLLDLHGDFYPAEAIERAVEAFSRFGPISVERRPPYHRVRLPASDRVTRDVLEGEFANYALAAALVPAGTNGPHAA